jgi:hypothetical protein
MNITVDLHAGRLTLPGAAYPVSCRVRTIREGAREAGEVIRSIPDNLPYDPQPFPKGVWNVTGLDWIQAGDIAYPTYGPVKIRTDAWQWVKAWELDAEGDYLRETGRRVRDTCYWLHYSAFTTTLGCIRLGSPEDAVAIANVIARALDREKVILEAG